MKSIQELGKALGLSESEVEFVFADLNAEQALNSTGKAYHPKRMCVGTYCTFHNPSNHKMKNWRTYLRLSGLTERICEHAVGHPDPDSVAWLIRVLGEKNGKSYYVHGCDGCCAGAYA